MVSENNQSVEGDKMIPLSRGIDVSKLDSGESRNTSLNCVCFLEWGSIGTQGLVVQNWREDPSGSKVEREDRESKQEPGLLKFNSFNCTVGTLTLSSAPLRGGLLFPDRAWNRIIGSV